MIECSVGIMAYNEEANIGALLDALLRQELQESVIRDIVVVASGCTDKTEDIVRVFARKSPIIHLVTQPRREGKASAINVFLGCATCDIVALVGADTLPDLQTMEFLLRPFANPAVGMTGGRPIPLNDPSGILGQAVHLQWQLHDRIASTHPKLGELIAFRRQIGPIPRNTAVDEVSIEARAHARGWKLVYVPEAVIHNRGPSTVRDFLRQRRRIHAGHLRVSSEEGYHAATMNVGVVLRLLLEEMSWKPSALLGATCAVALEATGRFLGHIDHVRRRDHQVWQRVDSTKDLFLGQKPRRLTRERVVLTFQIRSFDGIRGRLGNRGVEKVLSQMGETVHLNIRKTDSLSVHHADGIIVVLARTDLAGAQTMGQRLERVLKPVIAQSVAKLGSLPLQLDWQAYLLDPTPTPQQVPTEVQPSKPSALASLGG